MLAKLKKNSYIIRAPDFKFPLTALQFRRKVADMKSKERSVSIPSAVYSQLMVDKQRKLNSNFEFLNTKALNEYNWKIDID